MNTGFLQESADVCLLVNIDIWFVLSKSLTSCCCSLGTGLVRASVSLAHVRDEEDDSEGDAKGSHDDVADGQEVVGAAEDIGSWEHEVLATIEWIDLVRVLNRELVFTFGQVIFNLAVQLAEVGQTSCSHPDNEVL